MIEPCIADFIPQGLGGSIKGRRQPEFGEEFA
jgi:hypothetical protein